jgi:hypothetical protein
MSHIQDRLNGRGITNINENDCNAIARNVRASSAAIIMGQLGNQVSCEDGSNGDVVVLIVRHKHACTIMYRRSSQGFAPENFDTDIVDYAHHYID